MTTGSSPLATPLALIFSANSALLTRALTGPTDGQLWTRVVPGTNPMLWIAGHVVATRCAMVRLLGEPCDPGWDSAFARGAAVGADASGYPSSGEVLQVHDDVAPRIDRLLHALSAERMAEAAVQGPKVPGIVTVGDQIGFFARHDSYHIGQLGLLRKALGLDSLIG